MGKFNTPIRFCFCFFFLLSNVTKFVCFLPAVTSARKRAPVLSKFSGVAPFATKTVNVSCSVFCRLTALVCIDNVFFFFFFLFFSFSFFAGQCTCTGGSVRGTGPNTGPDCATCVNPYKWGVNCDQNVSNCGHNGILCFLAQFIISMYVNVCNWTIFFSVLCVIQRNALQRPRHLLVRQHKKKLSIFTFKSLALCLSNRFAKKHSSGNGQCVCDDPLMDPRT